MAINSDGFTVSDNTALWLYVGDQPMAANDGAAPTITSATGSTPFTNSVNWYPALYPALYTLSGLDVSTYATNYWTPKTLNTKSGTAAAVGGIISFYVDDAQFAVGSTSNSPNFGVIIDGRFISPQPALTSSSNPWWQVYSFGLRKRRLVQIVGGKSASNFAGVATSSTGVVTPAPAQEVNAVFIADSYGAGSSYGPFRAEGVVGTQLGLRMGWNVWNLVVGGTGLQNPGTSSYYTYLQRAQDSYNATKVAAANIIIIYGSTNDNSYTSASETAAATAMVQGLRAINPTAPIVWFGPASINATSAAIAVNQATDTAIQAGIMAASDSRTFYFPFANALISVPTTPGLTFTTQTPPIEAGSYLASTPSSWNSYSTMINQGDTLRPTDYGTRTITAWMAQNISAVLPGL